MEKLLELLKTRIWKNNFEDPTRQEMFSEIRDASSEVCSTLRLLIKKLKADKQTSQTPKYTQQPETYGEDRA